MITLLALLANPAVQGGAADLRMLSALGIGSFVSAAVLGVSRFVVLRRVNRLVQQVRAVEADPDRRLRVRPDGADEISALASQINQTLNALAQSELRFRTLIENAPVLIWRSDRDGTCNFFNRQWLAFTGRTVQQEINGGWLVGVHPEDLARCQPEYLAHVQARRAFDMEYRLRRYDGQYRWLAVSGIPMRHDDGSFAGYIGCCTDITERRLAQESMEHARAAAEAANTAKSAFLANMSHEIRTPMTAILGYTDLLLEAETDAADRQSAVRTIKRNGEHLLAVINDVLDFSKIEAGMLSVNLAPCRPMDVADDVLNLLSVRAAGKGLWLRAEIVGPAPAVLTSDQHRLRQIILNLVGNAIKFTEHGGVTVRYSFVDTGASHAVFEVIDTGIGLSTDQAARLFRPFTQADDSTTRRFGGTGLGLSISRALAQLLGGDITVSGSPGKGCTFTLQLPCPPAAPGDPCEMLPTGTREAGDSDMEPAEVVAPVSGPACEPELVIPRHILLVEDGVDNQRLISHHLRRAGAAPVIAENGQLGVEAVQKAIAQGHPFALILMDMQMPVLDGYSAASRLRQAGVQTPIIALTAHAMIGDREKCLAAGCNEYLTKPIDRSKLLRLCSALAAPAPTRTG